jgi:hypothetical protein
LLPLIVAAADAEECSGHGAREALGDAERRTLRRDGWHAGDIALFLIFDFERGILPVLMQEQDPEFPRAVSKLPNVQVIEPDR